MERDIESPDGVAAPVPAPDARFAANDVRLSPRGWLIAGLLIVLLLVPLPWVWQAGRPLRWEPDGRVPYRLSNDYWNYSQTCRSVCRNRATLLIGDSVVWGHYVKPPATLSHYLNEQSGGQHTFENLGVDGIHPVALAGLMQYYGSAVRNKRVILNCNLLWLSSPRHDLSSEKEAPFNHPALVPQFTPRIGCYRAPVSERVGIVVARHLPFLGFAGHLRIAYLDGADLPAWTLGHPYENPWQSLNRQLPSCDELPTPMPDPRPWFEKGLREITPQWVPLEESLQWQFFRQTVHLLQSRGNDLFVLIGPLNEAMLSADGVRHYHELREQVAAWHRARAVAHCTVGVLPSQDYADLSHPNAAGYMQLATRMFANEAFRSFLNKP